MMKWTRWSGFVLVSAAMMAQQGQLEAGRKALKARTGCFLVDYSFVETEAIKPGYVKDSRFYEANRDKSIKEWIYAEDISPTRVKLQHILQGVTLKGEHAPGMVLKHTGEDWEFNAPYLYDYTTKDTWVVKGLKATPNLWTRRVTSLDDGLRYQCAAPFQFDREYPMWTCEDLSPIPGREYRDMKRKDYQDLDRTSEVVNYGANWLERERNTKIVDESGVKTPLVKEIGKTWYARLPDSECSEAQEFIQRRTVFWEITREAWDEALDGKSTWKEARSGERYGEMRELEETYLKKNLNDPAVKAAAKKDVLALIEKYRVK